MISPWTYGEKDIHESNLDLAEYIGFVYEIRNKTNGMKYIGKKLFTKAGTKQVKGKKKKIRKPSDWESYFGSSPRFKEAVQAEGKDNFERRILRLCTTLSELSYWESWWIYNKHAIVDPMFYNDWISSRTTRAHLNKVATKILQPIHYGDSHE